MSPPDVVVDRSVDGMDVAVEPSGPATVAPSPTVSGASLSVWFDRQVPVLRLPESAADFEALRACVRDQLPSHVPEIAGRSLRLDLGAREIVLFDLRRLLHLLRQEFSLEVTGLYARTPAIHRFAERELKLKLFPVDERAAVEPVAEAVPEPAAVEGPPVVTETEALPGLTLPTDLTPADLAGEAAATPEVRNAPAVTPATPPPREEGRRTQVVHRTLRSGNVLRYDGDVFVFGDVNPGAQVVATGNITVLGALKGMAHAGAAGDETSFILAFDLRPTQLRIGRKIAIPPDRRNADLHPEIAAVSGEQIVLESYQGRRR